MLDLINLLQVPTNLPDGSRPENIVDGNVLTEWKIDPITNNASEIVFSFNLEKVTYLRKGEKILEHKSTHW